MTTLVSTGQITIVDNNDAKPLTAFITASCPTNQIYSKDESTITYQPDYTVTNLTLSAKVYVGGTSGSVDITSLLTSRKWSTDLGTSIGSNTTYVITQNMTTATPSMTYYFEGDYTDPNTGLMSHIIAQMGVSVTQTGTNAVYVQIRGSNVIEKATGTTKNSVNIFTDLIRASGVDDTGTTYQWYELPANTPINQASIPTYATKYAMQTTAQTNPAAALTLGTGVPATAGYYDLKGLIIGEPAVNGIGLYRVEAKDTDGKVYQGYFTIYDISDKYQTSLISTAGDKLQNGVGNTNVYPLVYYGDKPVSDQTGWVFKWYFYDGVAPGNRAGFIDTTRTAVAQGRAITAHTTGSAPQITFDGTGITFAVGDMVKLVTSSGTVGYYEVNLAASNSNTATLVIPAITSTFLNWKSALTTNQYVGGKFFVCTGTGATAGTRTSNGNGTTTGAQIPVTGYEIDVKGTIICEANRP